MADASVLEVFKKRNKESVRQQGGVGTLSAMRRTEGGDNKPTHADVTWQGDLLDMSTRCTAVGNQYSYALVCVDVGTRRVRGALMPSKSGEDAKTALEKLRRGVDGPKVLSTDQDRAFLSEPFQTYLRDNEIQHVTKDVLADNQIALVDSKMGQIKTYIAQMLATEADLRAGMVGASTWEIFLRSEPTATEADWHPYFTEAIKRLNEKKLDYLMGRSVEQTFEDD